MVLSCIKDFFFLGKRYIRQKALRVTYVSLHETRAWLHLHVSHVHLRREIFYCAKTHMVRVLACRDGKEESERESESENEKEREREREGEVGQLQFPYYN